jgi:hypothetical protein
MGVYGAGVLLSAVNTTMPVLLTYALVLACTGLGALGGNLLAGNLRAAGAFPASYCGAWLLSGLQSASSPRR